MKDSAPTFSQIKAYVEAIRRQVPEARVIGIRAAGKWTGETLCHDGRETFWVQQCDSPLQMRVALQEGKDAAVQVLLTGLDERELGEDILVRLAKRRLFPMDSWQILRTLFQARGIDPRVIRHGWIGDALLEAVPVEGFPPAPGGFLDAETVWPILLGWRIGFADERPDLLALLQWSLDAERVARFRSAPECFRREATAWLAAQAGPTAETVLHCVMSNPRPDALAIGLAAGVVFHREATGRLDKAAGKLEERFLGGQAPDPGAIERWHAAATEVVTLQLADAQRQRALLHRADEILREVGAEAYAGLSDTSPLGFDQRMAHFGKRLWDVVQSASPASLEPLTTARQAIRRHVHARKERRRLNRVEMALRLARWLVRGETAKASFASLAEAAVDHLAEGGFVDWARLTLRAGDPVGALSEAYGALYRKVTTVRERQAQRFAELLRDWTAAGSTGDALIPVERVIEEVVAPLAAKAPVLAIVIDGMSAAVWRELMADLTRQDWVALCEEGQGAVRPGLAAVPSVTEVSRASLLCGRLTQGHAEVERAGFADHPGLRGLGRSGRPPVLFHKPGLSEADGVALAADVRAEIGSSQRRVVGVVVNAVDDHLLKGEQIDTRWSRDEIKVLPILLHEAKAAGRTVILLADHGHVLEHQTQARPHEGGERWRVDDGAPAADELRIGGGRVVIPDAHRLIAPWSETVRYGIKKNGYHGGLSPQEMVVPIAVLCASEVFPSGWVEAPGDTPPWWDGEELPEARTTKAEAPPRVEAPVMVEPGGAKPLGPLFEHGQKKRAAAGDQVDARPAGERPAGWIDALLASPTFAEQKALAGRIVPADALVVRFLSALDRHGGKLTSAALARVIDYPSIRLRGLLAVLQRLLNVDGYAVLTLDEAAGSVELNRDLLCRQFEIGATPGCP